MGVVSEDALTGVLRLKLKEEVDDDLIGYLAAMLAEGEGGDDVHDQLHPFLESSGCSEELIQETSDAVGRLYSGSSSSNKSSSNNGRSSSTSSSSMGEVRKLKQGMVSMSLGDEDEKDDDTNRYLWGTDGKKVSYNTQRDAESSTISAKERRKQRQELEKARKQLQMQQKNAEEDEEQVSAMVLPDYSSNQREKDINVLNCSLSLDNGTMLLDHADIKFAYGRRYGLVGKNGIGKTTLLRAIANQSLSDNFPKHHRILHVRQEVRMSSANQELSVLETVLKSHVERNALLQQEKDLLRKLELADNNNNNNNNNNSNESDANTGVKEKRTQLMEQLSSSEDNSNQEFKQQLKELDMVYARLQMLSSDSAESRASTILSGLQFTTEMQAGPISALSGGWRMRVSLASALLMEPDVLMLDEPTNHLDLEAVLWLEQYLLQYPHTILVVSHDRSFLNEVCTDTIQFHNQRLFYYKGNYDTYVKTSQEQLKNQVRVYQAYMDKRTHLMEFIEKFRANAKRATLVQSRIKTVEKMDAEAPPPVEIETPWKFTIPSPDPLGRPVIAVDDVTFDYHGKDKSKQYLLNKVNFGIDLDTRMGILGPNGAGKSTLLNLMIGLHQNTMTPISGSVSRNPHLRLGHFTQHSSDKFDLTLSSVENFLNIFHADSEGDVLAVRQFLGKFQIQGTDAIKPMAMLSGGQKSRVAFAALAYQKPHVIILDEPTNHLDMESIDALIEALQNYTGGIVCVSHDQYFITQTCRDLWVVGDGQATKFRGDFEQYKQETLQRTAKRVAESVHTLSNLNK